MNKELVIGLDIGTSSLKLVVLNIETGRIELNLEKSTQQARIKATTHDERQHFDEQDVDEIVKLINQLFDQIPDYMLDSLKGIQLCGQMHGVVSWNNDSPANLHTNLITWQDSRCDENFLNNLPVKSVSDLNSGYGCASLFWLEFNEKFKHKNYSSMNCSGTIHDYLTYLISNRVVMSNQNALSWGFFDLKTNTWQKELIECKKFPVHLLPEVKEPNFKIDEKALIPHRQKMINTDIFVALGDLQCSVYSCLENETDWVINMSTSAQLCVSISKEQLSKIEAELPKSVSIFPYFGDRVLLVAASLNGGNVLDKFVDSLIEWNKDLGMLDEKSPLDRNSIWEKLISLGVEAAKNESTSSSVKCTPTVFAERHDKHTFASISNLSNVNITSIGSIFNSICRGLVQNLCHMINLDFLRADFKCSRLIATGSVFKKNRLVKHHLEDIFSQFQVVYKSSNDAALGAAYFLRDSYKNSRIYV